MFADRKRLQFSYVWSLPVVVAILFLAVAKLAAIERDQTISRFANQVAHSETDEATAAVRQLAALPRPPMELLVEAAASPNLDVSREARRALDNYLRHCRREIKAGRRLKTVAAQLAALAESLADQRPEFSTIDYPWVELTTREVLQLANAIPAGSTPILAAHCDEILQAVANDRRRATKPAAATITASIQLPSNPPTQDESRLAALAARPWSENQSSLAPALSPTQSSPALATHEARDQQFSVVRSPSAPPDDSTEVKSTSEPSTIVLPNVASDADWREEWSHPLLRTLPAMPISAAPIVESVNELRTDSARSHAKPIKPLDEASDDRQRYQSVDSRRLLERWLVAQGAAVEPLEQELARRGFGRLSERFVERLFAADVEVRLRLVDDMLTEPGVDARPWLLLLADDADPEVRLVVVTMLATSNDPALIEKAWQVVIHDRDPRIAGMAARLRERRNDLQRR